MNRDDIIRMAEQSGVEFDDEAATGMYGFSIWERFAALVAAAEREACAQAAEKHAIEIHGYDKHEYAAAIAKATGGSDE